MTFRTAKRYALYVMCAACVCWIVAWVSGITLIISLEQYIIPPYPYKTASLHEVIRYLENELDKQGGHTRIYVDNKDEYAEGTVVRGLAGNGYIYLDVVARVFNVDIRYRMGSVTITARHEN